MTRRQRCGVTEMATTDLTLRKQSALRKMADDYVDASTRALTARWAQAWNELAAEWREVMSTIIARKAAGEPLTPHQIIQLNRTQRALAMTRSTLDELAAELGDDLDAALQQVVARTADMTTDVIGSQLPDTRVYQSFTRVDKEALEQIIDRAMGRIVSQSSPLADDALEAVKASLIRAVPAGWHPNKAASEMLKRTRTSFNGGLARALRIARTEMLDAHRAANRAQVLANEDIMVGVVWHAELGPRTCPSCIAMHGQEFPPGTEGPEDHPNGRCTFLPKTKSWRDLGIDLDEPPDAALDPMAWIEDNPEDAIAALGPERYLMLQDGDIGLADMTTRIENPDWRASQQATSLADLRRKAAQ